ncbi:hypothetical protein KKD70_05340 [Patescibacteria group bacterium]|nr:hypothetical protein [Patescibacteria group bacterium]
MNSKISVKKRFLISSTVFVLLFTNMLSTALAAKFSLSNPGEIVKGCAGSINVMMDTEGVGVTAADSGVYYNPAEVAITSSGGGDVFPIYMPAPSGIPANMIAINGFTMPGEFSGTGVYGIINFTANAAASSGTFNFAPYSVPLGEADYTTIANALGIELITAAPVGRTVSFHDRYNNEISGGFCDPDRQAPTMSLINPANGSSGNDLDTNITFSLKDDRTGVNIDSLSFSIAGIPYTETSSQVSFTESGGVYSVTTNPAANFSEGQLVQISVYICDRNGIADATDGPANCATRTGNFRAWSPPPPDPVCGDGIATYSVGEQCDDGNTEDGDGCSALCLYETVEGEACPIVEECPECEVCEETGEEISDEILEEDLHEAADEEGVVVETPIAGCTREDVTREILQKFDVQKNYQKLDAACQADIYNCMLPFMLNSNYDNLDVTAGNYYPDVLLQGEATTPTMAGDTVVTKAIKDAINFGTRMGMVQGYYGEANSPFRPKENMTRMEIMKILNWATIGQKWMYEDEYYAMIGGIGNLVNVKTYAPDIKEWWHLRYYNAACEAGIIDCGTGIAFEPNATCSVAWKNNMIDSYYKFYKGAGGLDDTKDDDNDGLSNGEERYTFLTNTAQKDTDTDTLSDYEEIKKYNTNPSLDDSDNDGLRDDEEVKQYKTNPLKPDTDDDGFTDAVEVRLKTNPLNKADFPKDADQNGIDDEWERTYGVSTLNGSADFDGDGLSNLLEYKYGTSPINSDTDGDGLSDADEILTYGSDPLTATDLNSLSLRITNIKDGMILTDVRPVIQGHAPKPDLTIKLVLRNEFGGEIVLGTTQSDEEGSFIYTPEFDLIDGSFYLLAKSLDTEAGDVFESPLIGVNLDSKLIVDSPKPERLADTNISDDVLLEGVRIVIVDNKPVLVGRTGYKNKVFATWQSVLSTSAIVADLAGGEFEIAAPKELEKGDHKVTLYAIRESDMAMSKVITVNFEIKSTVGAILHGVAGGDELGMPWYGWVLIFITGVGLLVFGFWLDRKQRKKGQTANKK